MSFFVECDIEGCTEHESIDIESETPTPVGWSTIATVRAPSSEDAVTAADEAVNIENDGGLVSALKAGIAAGFMSSSTRMIDTHYVCPKHPLPRWRKTEPEPAATMQPELPGLL